MLAQERTRFAGRVGLDLGSHTINGVEVVEHVSEIVIRSVGSAAVPGLRSKDEPFDVGGVVHAIKELWSSAGFESKSVVLALPPNAVYVKWLHLEAADEDELDQTARTAAVRGAPFPSSDAITDYRVLSARRSGSRTVYYVMVVAASSPVMDLILNTVETAGLEPLAVDIAAAAAVRSFDTQKRKAGPLWSNQPLAHCILGARSTTIAVVRGDALEFARTIPVGGNDFTDCLAEYAGISWSEADMIKATPGTRLIENGIMIAPSGNSEWRVPCENVVGRLAREIQRSLRFFSSQFAEGSYLGMIGATTLSGGGALLKGIDECLLENGIEIAGIINPFSGFSVAAEGGIQNVGDSAAAYTSAMGLATGNYWSHGAQAEVAAAA